MKNRTAQFLSVFLSAYPMRSAVVIVLLAVAGLLEGIGIVTLIPVLEIAQGGSLEPGTVGARVTEAFQALGLTPTLGTLLTAIFVMILAKSVLTWLAMTQVGTAVIGVVRDLRLRLLRGLLRARWTYFGSESSGTWAAAVSAEAVQTGAAYREACEIIAAIFPITAYIALATAISWETSVFALVTGGLLVVLLKRFVAISRRAGRDQVELTKSLAGATVDVIHGLKPIKAMAREELAESMISKNVAQLEEAMRRTLYANWNLRFFQEPALTLFLALGIFFLFEVGGFPLSTVMVLAFVYYRVMRHINTMQQRYQSVVVGEAAYWSISDRLERTEGNREEIDKGKRVSPVADSLEFRSVCFAYGDRPVLKDLDWRVEAGSFVAVLGGSGAGKTTLLDIMTGLLEPASGSVLVDGWDLRDLSLRSWREQVGYVPQEMLLLNDTIRHNVNLGDDSITTAQVETALRMAGAWEFVTGRRDGIEERVGERGMRLSGGQRQRIAIARALVCQPSVLILDEVTTALDPDTEAAICQTLRELAGQVTIVSISHQLAMREVADIAYHMEAGRLSVAADVYA